MGEVVAFPSRSIPPNQERWLDFVDQAMLAGDYTLLAEFAKAAVIGGFEVAAQLVETRSRLELSKAATEALK